jgi:hypothetical protein
MGDSSGAMCSPIRNRGNCNVAAENLMTTMRVLRVTGEFR